MRAVLIYDYSKLRPYKQAATALIYVCRCRCIVNLRVLYTRFLPVWYPLQHVVVTEPHASQDPGTSVSTRGLVTGRDFAVACYDILQLCGEWNV